MTDSWMDQSNHETKATLERVRKEVGRGATPEDAINKNAHTAESYAAALREYNLSPVIPD
jgi:hypothetical protein